MKLRKRIKKIIKRAGQNCLTDPFYDFKFISSQRKSTLVFFEQSLADRPPEYLGITNLNLNWSYRP